MGLKFTCPACGDTAVAYGVTLGERTRCSGCGDEITVPLDPRLIEHVADVENETVELAPIDSGPDKRGAFVTLVLLVLGVINPLFGIMILDSALGQSEVRTTPIVSGILLILIAIPVYGLWRRAKWGYRGLLFLFGALAILSAVNLQWDVFFRTLISLFLFFLVFKSEREYLQ